MARSEYRVVWLLQHSLRFVVPGILRSYLSPKFLESPGENAPGVAMKRRYGTIKQRFRTSGQVQGLTIQQRCRDMENEFHPKPIEGLLPRTCFYLAFFERKPNPSSRSALIDDPWPPALQRPL